MRLLEGYSTLYTSFGVRVSGIRAKLVCLGVISKQARVAPEYCHGVQGWKWRYPLTGAFTTHIGSFKPTVMFFGMTNLPAIFQAMMNEILRDLINEGKVAVFVDDVLVEMETEEGHDKIVEEVLRRLEENNLYIKLEKCVWKARKIGFLEVVIGPNRIEMEKEKVNGVLSWLQPKTVSVRAHSERR